MSETESEKQKVKLDFSKIKAASREIEDAVIDLNPYKKVKTNYGDKSFILSALAKQDTTTLREISKFFYDVNGVYKRQCEYLAFLYRYDWFITVFSEKNVQVPENEPKILGDFAKVLRYLDNSDVKRTLANIALKIVVEGTYYGCVLDLGDRFVLQQLPSDYCRVRFYRGLDPIVELNMRFFDAYFPQPQQRLAALQCFPEEVQLAYIAYKEGKLQGDYPGDTAGYFALDPDTSIKFNLNGSDTPLLVASTPSLLDLDAAQEMDRRKTMQQLLKIIIQKVPLDKNGDLIFDGDEIKDIHETAVKMLRRAIGIDVLTTFADIDVADMRDKNSTVTQDDLQKIERTVFNNFGTSQNLFNTEGSTALEKSVRNDEAVMGDLVRQFETFLNRIVGKKFNRANHYSFSVDVLETTIYNYTDLSKMYKEQTQIGYSKMLPQVALGHSQSSIIAAAHFENNILHLSDIMIPPLSSNTMSGKDLTTRNTSGNIATTRSQSDGEGKTGRPELPEDQKSDKTLKNEESK